MAAMRAALEAARDLLLPHCNGRTAFAKACGETVNKIMDALAAPPRNCDRFYLDEAYERFRGYVHHENPCFIADKPLHTVWDALKWALDCDKKEADA